MPKLSHKFAITVRSEPSCSRLYPLSAQFWLPLFYTQSELMTRNLSSTSSLEEAENKLVFCNSIFSIFPKNTHSEEFSGSPQISIQERTKEINEALLRLFVAKRGGLIEGTVFNTISGSNDSEMTQMRQVTMSLIFSIFHNCVPISCYHSLLSPVEADFIATTAVGLSKADPSKSSLSDSSSQPVVVHTCIPSRQSLRNISCEPSRSEKMDRGNRPATEKGEGREKT